MPPHFKPKSSFCPGNLLSAHSPPSDSGREGRYFYLENLEEKQTTQALPLELQGRDLRFEINLVDQSVWGCILSPDFCFFCITCHAVGDIPSVVREPELLPPQGLARLLVSEFVPGEGEKTFRGNKILQDSLQKAPGRSVLEWDCAKECKLHLVIFR